MLKTIIIILFALLSLASSRSLAKEDICEVEKVTWEQCFAGFLNGLEEMKQEGENATVSPGDRVIQNLKNTLDCVGDITCKGQNKFTKFQLDTIVFALDHIRGGGACANQTGEDFHCIFDHLLLEKAEYNGEILTCTQEILDISECSPEEKMSIMRGARAQNDFMEVAFVVKNNGWASQDFDETFDPSKYD